MAKKSSFFLQKWHIVFIALLLLFVAIFINIPSSQKQELGFTRQLLNQGEFKGAIPGIFDTTVSHTDKQVEVTVKRGDTALSFQLPIEQTAVTAGKNLLSFSSPNETITTEYSLMNDGIKENIILNKIPQENIFPSTLKTEGLITKITSEGIPVFYDKSNMYQFHFQRPFVKDAKGNISYDVKYVVVEQTQDTAEKRKTQFATQLLSESKTINQTSGTYILNVEVNAAWLHDPHRVLPIIIDPTVVHNTSSTFATGTLDRVADTGSGSSPKIQGYYKELTADQYTAGLWHMNESSGNVLDASGNSNTGTPTGTSVVAGVLGNARSFNGSTDLVAVANSTSLQVGSQFTVEAWIYPTNLTNRIGIFSTRTANTAGSWQLEVGPGNAGASRVSVTGVGTFIYDSASNAIQTNRWTHIAYTRNSNGDTGTMYVDGVEVIPSAIADYTILDNTDQKRIGEGTSGTQRFLGYIDELRLSTIARSADEIKADASRTPSAVYTSPVIDLTAKATVWNSFTWSEGGVATGYGETPYSTTNLLAQWNLNDRGGTTANADLGSCGSTCDGTLTGFSNTSNSDVLPGDGWTAVNQRWGAGALMFDGASDYITVPAADGGALDLDSGAITLEAWVKPNINTIQRILFRGTNGVCGYGLSISVNSNGKFNLGNAGGGNFDSNTVVVPGRWYYVVGVINGTSNSRLYVNGNLETIGSVSPVACTSLPLNIGRDPSSIDYFNGVIDTPRIYSRALGADEILSNYNSSNIDFQTRVGSSTDPNDGTWEAWKSTANESQMTSFDSYTQTQPNSIANLGLWLKADALALSDGTAVTTWADSSGNGRDFAQAVSGQKPIYKTNIINGKPVVRFVASNSQTMTNSTNFSTPSTVVYVSRQSGSANFRMLSGLSNNWLLGYWNGSKRQAYFTGWLSQIGGTPTDTKWHIYTSVHNGSTSNAYEDGNLYATGTGGPGGPNGLSLNGATGTSEFSDGDIAEVIVYSRGISDIERNQVESYLANKYGLVNNTSLSPQVNPSIKMEGTGSYRIFPGTLASDSATLALWHLDETGGTGAYLKDVATSASYLTPTGTTVVNGIAQKGRNFNGTSDSLSCTDANCGGVGKLDPGSGNFSIEAWVKTTKTTRQIFAGKGIGTGQFAYSLESGLNFPGVPTILFYSTADGIYISADAGGGSVISDNKWHYVVGTYNGTTASIYVDGTLRNSSTTKNGTQVTDSTSNFEIGARNGNTLTFSGSMDEVRISSVARSPQEIDENYRMERNKYLNLTLSTTDLSTKTTLPFYVAADRPGTYLSSMIGESNYANYQPDSNTVGLWHLEENNPSWSTTFPGATIDTGAWAEIDPNANKISQNAGLVLSAGTVAAWDSGVISKAVYARQEGLQIYGKFTTGASVAAPNHMMFGFGQDQTVSGSYTNISHALYFNAGAFYVYQDSVQFGGPYGSGFVASTTYEVRITLNPGGRKARYEVKGGVYTDWTTLLAADAEKVNTPLRAEVAQYQTVATFNTITVNTPITLTDSSGGNNTATVSGALQEEGKLGKARSFSGLGDYVTARNAAPLQISGALTLDAWVKTTASVTYRGIIGKMGNAGGGYGYLLRMAGATLPGAAEFGISSTGSNFQNVVGTTLINDGNWHHVAGVYVPSTSLSIYVDGILQAVNTTSIVASVYNSPADVSIGSSYSIPSAAEFTNGTIDEPRISNTARTAEEIRSAYEAGARSHPITIDFGAKLDSGDLITNSSDPTFTVDATYYGLNQKGTAINLGDKIIVRENYNGVEYIAQGTVNSVTVNTGALTVDSWDTGSTFPSGGFTANADVFKWQREYWNLSSTMYNQRNATALLTLRITDGNEGRNFFLDDLESNTNYLTIPTGSTITSSTGNRYFQYRTIFTSSESTASATLTSATLNYAINSAPTTPTLNSPVNGATNVPTVPTLKTTSTDPDLDYLQYRIEYCTNLAMSAGCQTAYQPNTQSGWSGQNTQTNTAYTSGSQGAWTLDVTLANNTTYYWRSYAIDPAGTNTYSSTQTTPFSFTTSVVTGGPATACKVTRTNGTNVLEWTDNATNEAGYAVQRNVNNGGWVDLNMSLGANTVSLIDSSIQLNSSYQYRVAPYTAGPVYESWCTMSLQTIGNGTLIFGGGFNFSGVDIK